MNRRWQNRLLSPIFLHLKTFSGSTNQKRKPTKELAPQRGKNFMAVPTTKIWRFGQKLSLWAPPTNKARCLVDIQRKARLQGHPSIAPAVHQGIDVCCHTCTPGSASVEIKTFTPFKIAYNFLVRVSRYLKEIAKIYCRDWKMLCKIAIVGFDSTILVFEVKNLKCPSLARNCRVSLCVCVFVNIKTYFIYPGSQKTIFDWFFRIH